MKSHVFVNTPSSFHFIFLPWLPIPSHPKMWTRPKRTNQLSFLTKKKKGTKREKEMKRGEGGREKQLLPYCHQVLSTRLFSILCFLMFQ